MLIRGKFMKIPLSTKQSAGYSSLDSSERGWLNSNEDYALSHGSSELLESCERNEEVNQSRDLRACGTFVKDLHSTHGVDSAASPTLMDELLLSSSLKREEVIGDELVNRTERAQSLLQRTTSISLGRAAPFIILPREHCFQSLRRKQRFSVDIGGTLVKLVYSSVASAENVHFVNSEPDLLLNFRKFQSIDHCIAFLKKTWVNRDADCFLNATGGGSYKFADMIEKELGVKMIRTDEMHSLIAGCDFLLRNNEDESFSYHHEAIGIERYQYRPIEPESIYPFLLCNIGTGISILKVDSPTSFTRVGGSTMGGGAFIGLGNLLTSAKTFDDLLILAERGDHRKVDTLVSDIYGGDYENLNLRGDVIAGSFGKCSQINKSRETGEGIMRPHEEDLAKSLLLMISNNIGQMAILYGNRFDLKRIYFGGFFIRKHPISMRTLSYAIDFWSKGECSALFLKHEGYLGAVGSFLDKIEMTDK